MCHRDRTVPKAFMSRALTASLSRTDPGKRGKQLKDIKGAARNTPRENLFCQAVEVDMAGSVRLCRVSLHWPEQELKIGGGPWMDKRVNVSQGVRFMDCYLATPPGSNPISAPYCVTLGSCTTSLPSEAFLHVK